MNVLLSMRLEWRYSLLSVSEWAMSLELEAVDHSDYMLRFTTMSLFPIRQHPILPYYWGRLVWSVPSSNQHALVAVHPLISTCSAQSQKLLNDPVATRSSPPLHRAESQNMRLSLEVSHSRTIRVWTNSFGNGCGTYCLRRPQPFFRTFQFQYVLQKYGWRWIRGYNERKLLTNRSLT